MSDSPHPDKEQFLVDAGLNEEQITVLRRLRSLSDEELRRHYAQALFPSVSTKELIDEYLDLGPETIPEAIAQSVVLSAQALADLLTTGTQRLTGSVDQASQFVVAHTEQGSPVPLCQAAHVSQSAKDWSDKVRIMCQSSIRSLGQVSSRVPVPKVVPPAVVAVSEIGLATVGGVTVVSDSIFQNSGTLGTKLTASVGTIVTHKWGSDSGQLVENVAGTVGNVVRIAGCLAILSVVGVSKTMVKQGAKTRMFSKIPREL